MLRKTTIATAIATSIVSFSAAANAGSTITDKSYWPNEIRQQTLASRERSAVAPLDSFAYEGRSGTVAPRAGTGTWTYNGGPKAR